MTIEVWIEKTYMLRNAVSDTFGYIKIGKHKGKKLFSFNIQSAGKEAGLFLSEEQLINLRDIISKALEDEF